MKSLLEKALDLGNHNKSKKLKRPVTKEECELFVATLEGKITLRQYANVMGFNPKTAGNISQRSMTVLRNGIENGWISVTFIK